MPNPYNFMGLSDLGQTKPSVSSNVDDSVGPSILEQLLGNSNQMLDDTARAKILEQSIGQTQAQPDQSILDQLLSPQGLVSLLGTGAAGAIGGGEAAAGFGFGSLQGAGAAAEAKNATKRMAIEEMEKRLDETNKRLDNSRNRVAQMFNTNPEAFVNPVTGEQTVPPDVLGFYTTGLPIPTFATTRRIMNQRDERWKETQGLLTESLKNAQSQDDARGILDVMFQHLKFDAPPGLSDSIARAHGTKEWQPAIISALMNHSDASIFDALIFAGENKLDPMHPEVLRRIRFRDPDAANNKITKSDTALNLAREVNDWQSRPENLDRIRELRQEHGKNGEGAVSYAIAQEVLGGRRGDFDTYVHEFGVKDPQAQLLQAQTLFNFKSIQEKYGLGVSISGIKGADPVSQMSDEEQNQFFWGKAEELSQEQLRMGKETHAKQDVSMTNQAAIRLRKDLGLSAADANEVSGVIVKRALQASTRPDGKVDRARFEQEVRKLTDEAIKDVKGE